MTTYDYNIAKAVLTESEKDRFLACYLNGGDGNTIDWQKAATDYGSASVESFKKMLQNSLKKVKAAEAKAANGESVAPPTPAKGGKKRKAAAEVDEEGEETPKPKAKRGRKANTPAPKTEAGDKADGEIAEEAPKAKATRARKGKKATPKSDGGDGGDGETVVKAEESD